MKVILIAAFDAEQGLGVKNTLPWKLPEDMARFKSYTLDQMVIMGRSTLESIGRALPKRSNIVLTRNPSWSFEGCITEHSLDAALEKAHLSHLDSVFIIGGAQVYEEAIHKADSLLITEIHQSFDCDAFFPRIDPLIWEETHRTPTETSTSGLTYSFVSYHRRVADLKPDDFEE